MNNSIKIFNKDNLIKVYSFPNLRSVSPGNKVMLRSGGTKMIVDYPIDEFTCMCSYEEDSKYVQEIFDLRCLTCWGQNK